MDVTSLLLVVTACCVQVTCKSAAPSSCETAAAGPLCFPDTRPCDLPGLVGDPRQPHIYYSCAAPGGPACVCRCPQGLVFDPPAGSCISTHPGATSEDGRGTPYLMVPSWPKSQALDNNVGLNVDMGLRAEMGTNPENRFDTELKTLPTGTGLNIDKELYQERGFIEKNQDYKLNSEKGLKTDKGLDLEKQSRLDKQRDVENDVYKPRYSTNVVPGQPDGLAEENVGDWISVNSHLPQSRRTGEPGVAEAAKRAEAAAAGEASILDDSLVPAWLIAFVVLVFVVAGVVVIMVVY